MEALYLHSVTHKTDVVFDLADPLPVTGIFVDGSLLFSAAKYLALKKIQRNISQSWERQFIQSVRLLIDYSIVHEGYFKNPKEMFEQFSHRLSNGIYIPKEGLLWSPKQADTTNRLIKQLTNFSDWLYDDSDGNSGLLNPLREATPAERLLNLAAYNHKMNNSFLKHTYPKGHQGQSVNYSRNVRGLAVSRKPDEPKKSFPEECFMSLLFDGFKNKSAKLEASILETHRVDYILITLLMHTYGLRVSEVFQLYTRDIIPVDENKVMVQVFHPSKGNAPQYAKSEFNNQHLKRGEYLSKKFGMKDRKTQNGALHAGWKNESVSMFPAFFFAEPEYNDLFIYLFKLYLASRAEPLKGREHPFLFTNDVGDPLTLTAYVQAHARAVKKIGMRPLLEYGGKPHCHRHSYGQRLADAGIEPRIIKDAMHHASLESQASYTQAHSKKIGEALRDGTSKLVERTIYKNAALPASIQPLIRKT